MKKILLYTGCIFFILNACKKLDQEPRATASQQAVFGSEKGLQLYTGSFYNNLPFANDIVRADNMSDYAARTDVVSFLTATGFGPDQAGGWSWTALRNINYFIENNTNTAVPEAIRNNYTATARFFRALFTSTK